MAFSTRSSPITISIFTFGQEIDDIFGPAIELGVALLPAKALGFGHGNALQTHFLKRLFHLVELEWLDDRLDFFHVTLPALQRWT